jgi:hypothetical protein
MYENRIMKPNPLKWFKKSMGIRNSNRGGKLDQRTLYACMDK